MRNILYLSICLLLSFGCVSNIMDESVVCSETTEYTRDICSRSGGASSYYWYNDQKVYLPVSENSFFAVFRSSAIEDMPRLSLLNTNIEFSDYKLHASYFKEKSEEKFFWAKVDSEIVNAFSDEIVYLAPYLVANASELGVTDRFYVKLKSENDYELLKDFALENGAEIVTENLSTLWCSLVCTKDAAKNALTLSNMAYESGMFAKTDIELMGDFSWDIISYPYNDQYFLDQWNLHGTFGIDIEGVNSITYGSGSVKVAVVDSGILLNNPDLPINMSWDAVSESSPARLYYDSNSLDLHSHGTEMASIIGAIPNNSLGIAGIAPGVTLCPISMGADPTDDIVDKAIRFAADMGTEVISNSYSYLEPRTLILDAFNYALEKGCVLVQSSGNINRSASRYPYASIPEVISVGNVTSEGQRWVDSNSSYGSTYGQHLDIMAPGTNIKVLKATGEYDVCTGTSPACPHVAAAVALMLSVNPHLTPQEVSDILECTARKLPGYDFVNNVSRPNGSWNYQVGYGLIDVVAALRLAKGYYNLMSFTYSGQNISLSITAQKDIAIIWDWDTEDITEVSITSPTTRTFTHTYSSSGTRCIYIAEKIDFETDSFSIPSSALLGFDLSTGGSASSFSFGSINTALEYIRIIGGADMQFQTISIKNLPALEELYLVKVPNINVNVENCSALQRFGSSRYIWDGMSSNQISRLHPVSSMEGAIDPNVVGPVPLVWPSVPENVTSFGSLSITNCNNLRDVSLENVNICSFDFSAFPYLRYLYLSSKADRIVGGSENILSPSSRGQFLANTIQTLPQRSEDDNAKIIIRGVNDECSEFVDVRIDREIQDSIEINYAGNKNWEVVWDSGVTNSIF